MKYVVIATKWDSTEKTSIKYIAGQFDSFINAKIFSEAYNIHFSANSKIVEISKALND